jgi:hypothetical protein
VGKCSKIASAPHSCCSTIKSLLGFNFHSTWANFGQIRKTNEERQRGWDEYNAKKQATAKKKREAHEHHIAMQVI